MARAALSFYVYCEMRVVFLLVTALVGTALVSGSLYEGNVVEELTASNFDEKVLNRGEAHFILFYRNDLDGQREKQYIQLAKEAQDWNAVVSVAAVNCMSNGPFCSNQLKLNNFPSIRYYGRNALSRSSAVEFGLKLSYHQNRKNLINALAEEQLQNPNGRLDWPSFEPLPEMANPADLWGLYPLSSHPTTQYLVLIFVNKADDYYARATLLDLLPHHPHAIVRLVKAENGLTEKVLDDVPVPAVAVFKRGYSKMPMEPTVHYPGIVDDIVNAIQSNDQPALAPPSNEVEENENSPVSVIPHQQSSHSSESSEQKQEQPALSPFTVFTLSQPALAPEPELQPEPQPELKPEPEPMPVRRPAPRLFPVWPKRTPDYKFPWPIATAEYDPPSQYNPYGRIQPGTCGRTKINILIGAGSQVANDHSIPFIVRFISKGLHHHHCAGVLISNGKPDETDLVLTTASCEAKSFFGFSVIAGAHRRKKQKHHVKVAVKKFIPHDKYDKKAPSLAYDIALVQLKESIKFTDDIQPICLPDNPTCIPADARGLLIGWGSERKNKHALAQVRQLDKLEELHQHILTTVPSKVCEKAYGEFHGPLDMIVCATDDANAKPAPVSERCESDTGSPYIVPGPDGFTLAGVNVVGYGCYPPVNGQASDANTPQPGAFVNVPTHLNWINAEKAKLAASAA